MNPVLRVAGLAVLAVLAVLAGCSTPPEPADDKVATLETTGATPTSVSSVAPPQSRPRERLDMTNEELDELSRAYDDCLAEHGSPNGKPAGGGGDGGDGPADAVPEAGWSPEDEAAADAACLHTKPLPPWEYDVANPESADFVHAVVQCLRDKGVQYVEEVPANPGEDRWAIAFGGPDNHSESISKGLNLIGTCEKEQTNR